MKPLSPAATSAFCSLAFVLAATAAQAQAVCGNGTVEAPEICDDGNSLDGDCCTSTCGMPTGCQSPGKSQLIVKDLGDNREDKIMWKWERGTIDIADFGHPLTTTNMPACVWDDGVLVQDMFIQAAEDCIIRPCWRVATKPGGEPRGYKYDNKKTNDDGVRRLLIDVGRKPGKARHNLRGQGIKLEFPGAVSPDQYFNQTQDVTLQLINDDSVCWESVYTDHKANKFKRFKAVIVP